MIFVTEALAFVLAATLATNARFFVMSATADVLALALAATDRSFTRSTGAASIVATPDAVIWRFFVMLACASVVALALATKDRYFVTSATADVLAVAFAVKVKDLTKSTGATSTAATPEAVICKFFVRLAEAVVVAELDAEAERSICNLAVAVVDAAANAVNAKLLTNSTDSTATVETELTERFKFFVTSALDTATVVVPNA
jgi:hypothetical protein